MLEEFEFFLFEFFFGLNPDRRIVGSAILDEVPDDPGQLVYHGIDGFWGSESSFPAAETIAEPLVQLPASVTFNLSQLGVNMPGQTQ